MSLTLKSNEGWFQDISLLIERSVAIFEKLDKDPVSFTSQKIIETREWVVKEAEILDQVRELRYLYVPKKMFPGPMFLFPEVDLEGKLRAQTKPLHSIFGSSKYYTMGISQDDFLGPIWLGNTEKTLEQIAKNKWVVLVEGPFDLLAARAMAPNIPIMSTTSKNVGKSHEDYLRILGVKTLYLMFDNEESEAGAKTMRYLKSQIKTMEVVSLVCPDSDPSDCLKTQTKKNALKRVLTDLGE